MAKPSLTRKIVVAAGILLALIVLTAIVLQLFISSS
jgi:preprotein translocase subunit Sec61beta